MSSTRSQAREDLARTIVAWRGRSGEPLLAQAAPAALLRIRERCSILGRELFIVTAAGPPALFVAHAQDIDNWFASSAFVPVEEGK